MLINHQPEGELQRDDFNLDLQVWQRAQTEIGDHSTRNPGFQERVRTREHVHKTCLAVSGVFALNLLLVCVFVIRVCPVCDYWI